MSWLCVTFGYQLVSTPPGTLFDAGLPPSWLKPPGSKPTATFLTPFFPPLARHAFNSSIVYHLQEMGEGVPPTVWRSLTACSLPTFFPKSLLIQDPSPRIAGTRPLSSFPTARLPRQLSRGAAKTLLLSPFTRSLTQKQGVQGIGHTNRSLRQKPYPFLHKPPSTFRFLSLNTGRWSPATGRWTLPCPSTHFPLKWGYPFPVITGENQ